MDYSSSNQRTEASIRPKAWYALRRTLPPWSFDLNIEELERVLLLYRIDELVVKVDTEEFSHGQPTLKMAEEYVPRLLKIKKVLEGLGITYSLNPWITVGHCDRGRDDGGKLVGFQGLVGHDGVVCKSCACPLGEAWRENIAGVWSLYAETQPDVFWIEDDIRTFNHEPVKWSCFCPLHLKHFSQRVGRTVDRETLVNAILQAGKPHPWRGEYLDLQSHLMTETGSFLAGVVHRVSPETSIGLMSSGPRAHCVEGREWSKFAKAVSNGKTLYSRPPMGNYWEGNLRGFYYSQDSIKLTRHCLPAGVVEQTEVENVPFTRYSKSILFTFLEAAISFAYGSDGVTLNLFDHSGTPMEEEPWYGRMLASKKPFFEAIAKKAQGEGEFCGVQLLHYDRSSYIKELSKGCGFSELGEDGSAMMEVLEGLGIPTTYSSSKVVGSCGQQILAASDPEIRSMLSKGMILDGRAACALVSRGFGGEIGIRQISPPQSLDTFEALSSEEFHNVRFGGKARMFMTLTLPSILDRASLCSADLVPEIELISSFVNPDAQRVRPAMYSFENSLGGRVVVHLLDLKSAFGIAFMHPHRLLQFQGAVRWLSRDNHPLFVRGGVYPLAFRKDCQDCSLIGFFNLSLDPWNTVEFECCDDREIQTVQVLHGNVWCVEKDLFIERSDKRIIIFFHFEIGVGGSLFIEINWKSSFERRRQDAVSRQGNEMV